MTYRTFRLPDKQQSRYYQRPGMGDCPLRGWRAVGLRHPSTVRISKLLAVDREIIKRILGIVSAQDLNQVEKGLREALDLQ